VKVIRNNVVPVWSKSFWSLGKPPELNLSALMPPLGLSGQLLH